MLSINLPGPPIPWKRPAHRIMSGKVVVFDAQSREKEQIRWRVKGCLASRDLLTCPLSVTMTFSFLPPKSCSKVRRREYISGMSNHMTKPDIDNLAKFYMDCLTGSVIQDDCQVFSLTLNKVYAETECTKIMITPVRALDSKELSENKSLADGWIDC